MKLHTFTHVFFSSSATQSEMLLNYNELRKVSQERLLISSLAPVEQLCTMDFFKKKKKKIILVCIEVQNTHFTLCEVCLRLMDLVHNMKNKWITAWSLT